MVQSTNTKEKQNDNDVKNVNHCQTDTRAVLNPQLGMLLRKEPGFVTPIQIHSSPPVCELFGIENKHPPTLLSSPLSMAKHSCTACDMEE
ncbi:hypothetical protein JOQ06_016707 [Pogonophryne albipinna]|uniref:Uncharacterized protein n=1 Tax=Pogonophryne albipinna TaxID=1090488 RepID=A0AAD6AZU4_9TELE|nr:hypothetical protein JOQ06_016707 [Pogonophryne albipinna]